MSFFTLDTFDKLWHITRSLWGVLRGSEIVLFDLSGLLGSTTCTYRWFWRLAFSIWCTWSSKWESSMHEAQRVSTVSATVFDVFLTVQRILSIRSHLYRCVICINLSWCVSCQSRLQAGHHRLMVLVQNVILVVSPGCSEERISVIMSSEVSCRAA